MNTDKPSLHAVYTYGLFSS